MARMNTETREDVINDNGDNLRPNQYPLVATQKKYINNNNNIDRQQQFRSPTSRAARGIKEIGLDS